MSEVRVINEDTISVVNFINDLDIKRVLFGGYDKIDVYAAIQKLCSMYEAIITKTKKQYEDEFDSKVQLRLQEQKEQLEGEFARKEEALRGEIAAKETEAAANASSTGSYGDPQQKSIREDMILARMKQLELDKGELEEKLKKNEQKYKREMVKLISMKEQLADMIVQQEKEKEDLLAQAEMERQKILADAQKQADEIIDNHMVNLNQSIDAKKRELTELEQSRKAGYSIIDNIQSEISQLSFKLTYVKRILAKSEDVTESVEDDEADEQVENMKNSLKRREGAELWQSS